MARKVAVDPIWRCGNLLRGIFSTLVLTNLWSISWIADASKIIDWYMDGKIQIGPMITHVLKLEEINRSFDPMLEGKSTRSVAVY